MYQKNINSYYNRHYGKKKPGELDSPSKMLHNNNNRRMLEEDSEDEFISNTKKVDEEQKLKEQRIGRVMFLITAVILLVNFFKSASESFNRFLGVERGNIPFQSIFRGHSYVFVKTDPLDYSLL